LRDHAAEHFTGERYRGFSNTSWAFGYIDGGCFPFQSSLCDSQDEFLPIVTLAGWRDRINLPLTKAEGVHNGWHLHLLVSVFP
jgi:hypothetical protein